MGRNRASALEESRIRHQFVGMLFALTIAQIAVHFYDIWSIPDVGRQFWAALAHLVLCTLLVITSWVGWSRSKAPGIRQHVQGVFSWLFIVLLLDVLLVVLYFIMVRKVEIRSSLLGGKYFAEPSAREETWWMIWVFAAYVAWDIVADLIVKSGRCWPKLILEKLLASVVCLILTIGAYFTTAVLVHNVLAVVSTDAALITLVFLFRAMKPLEHVWRHALAGGSLRRRFRRVKRVHWEVACVFPFFVLFVIFLRVAHVLEPAVR